MKIRRRILQPKDCLRRNAVVITCGADFKVTGVTLVFASWLSHIICRSVDHGHLRRKYGFSPALYPPPPPVHLSGVVCIFLATGGSSTPDIA